MINLNRPITNNSMDILDQFLLDNGYTENYYDETVDAILTRYITQVDVLDEDGDMVVYGLTSTDESALLSLFDVTPISPDEPLENKTHKETHEIGGIDELNGDNIVTKTDHSPFVAGSILSEKFGSIASGFQEILNDIASLGNSITSLVGITNSHDSRINMLENNSGSSSDPDDYPFWSYSFEQNKELTPSIQQLKAVTPKYFLSTVGSPKPNAWHSPSSMTYINNGRFVCPSNGFYQIELQLTISELADRNYERGVYGYFEIDGYNFAVVTSLWIKKENGNLHIHVMGTIPLIAGQELGISISCVRSDMPNDLSQDVKLEVTEGWATIIKKFNGEP